MYKGLRKPTKSGQCFCLWASLVKKLSTEHGFSDTEKQRYRAEKNIAKKIWKQDNAKLDWQCRAKNIKSTEVFSEMHN